MDLNILDIVFIVLIFLSILFGVIKGFIRELFALAFFILAVILSFLYYYDSGTFFLKYLKDRNLSNFAGFVLIFVVVLSIGAVVTYIIKKLFVLGPLKSVDRILGGVFGLLRGILLSMIIVFGLITFSVNENLIVESKFSPYAIKVMDLFLEIMPTGVQKKINSLTI